MELRHAEPAVIWRMLIPQKQWLCVNEVPDDELVFFYRDHVYFVNDDGSVVALPKPAQLEKCNLQRLHQMLAVSEDTCDFDDEGMFDYGSILLQMGYIATVKEEIEQQTYLVEIVNTLEPQVMIHRYELKGVSSTYALYHALLRCRELNEKTDWVFEHEVNKITPVQAKKGEVSAQGQRVKHRLRIPSLLCKESVKNGTLEDNQ